MTNADLQELAYQASVQATWLQAHLKDGTHTDAARAYLAALVSGAVESLRQAADLAERRREG